MNPEQSRPVVPLDAEAREIIAQWVSQHWDGVYGMAYCLTGNRNDASDLSQEAFLKAALRRASFVEGTNLRAWLLRIVTNAFLDARRRKKSGSAEALPEEAAAACRAPTEKLVNEELRVAVAAAVAELPDTTRVIFLLRTQEQLSFSDIALHVGTTEETARWHMMQARRRLMRQLDGWT